MISAFGEIGLDPPAESTVNSVYIPLLRWIEDSSFSYRQPFVLGIAGSQGSGKTTLARILGTSLEAAGRRVARLSLDDLYLTKAERRELARREHPLLETRGVPGTHDLDLGHDLLDRLATVSPGHSTDLPRFDKAIDDRRPESDWPRFQGRPDIVILEGWCLGARPEPAERLESPVNEFEASEDPEGRWRHAVNERLAGDYADFFNRLDRLVFLRTPSWEVVFEWRKQQEAELRRAVGGGMTEDQLRGFIQHYERITRWMIEDSPDRCDVLLRLRADHAVETIRFD